MVKVDDKLACKTLGYLRWMVGLLAHRAGDSGQQFSQGFPDSELKRLLGCLDLLQIDKIVAISRNIDNPVSHYLRNLPVRKLFNRFQQIKRLRVKRFILKHNLDKRAAELPMFLHLPQNLAGFFAEGSLIVVDVVGH